MKCCEKFYEVWREGELVQTTTDTSKVPLAKGDIILEYMLNSVKVVEGYNTTEGEW